MLPRWLWLINVQLAKSLKIYLKVSTTKKKKKTGMGKKKEKGLCCFWHCWECCSQMARILCKGGNIRDSNTCTFREEKAIRDSECIVSNISAGFMALCWTGIATTTLAKILQRKVCCWTVSVSKLVLACHPGSNTRRAASSVLSGFLQLSRLALVTPYIKGVTVSRGFKHQNYSFHVTTLFLDHPHGCFVLKGVGFLSTSLLPVVAGAGPGQS